MVVDLLAFSCMFSLLLTLASVWLLVACARRKRAVVASVDGEAWEHEVLRPLKVTLLNFANPQWSQTGRFTSLRVIAPKAEEADSEQTLSELLDQIANDCRETFDSGIKLGSLEQFSKSVYRLQEPLRLTDAAMADIMSTVVDRVRGSVLLSKKVDRVDLVQTGARVDEKTMWPLNPGLRVKQPYGLVLRTSTGEVLSRAKAKCR